MAMIIAMPCLAKQNYYTVIVASTRALVIVSMQATALTVNNGGACPVHTTLTVTCQLATTTYKPAIIAVHE